MSFYPGIPPQTPEKNQFCSVNSGRGRTLTGKLFWGWLQRRESPVIVAEYRRFSGRSLFLRKNAFKGLTGVTAGPINRPPDANNVTRQNGDASCADGKVPMKIETALLNVNMIWKGCAGGGLMFLQL